MAYKSGVDDLMSTATDSTSNPFDGLITECNDDPKLLQERYHLHRVTRNNNQKEKILAEDFPGWILDEFLTKLDGPLRDSTYVDPRNCMVFWARPPKKVKNMIDIVQSKLRDVAPDIWLMPLERLHLTVSDTINSKTPEEISKLVETIEPSSQAIADYTSTHRARLIKPMVTYDSGALALSFLPAAGEETGYGRRPGDDDYTYHHLRRDVHQMITDGGVKVGARYYVPSAHLTIARFNSPNVFGGDPADIESGMDMTKRKRWIREIETINKWLEAEYWPDKDKSKNIKPGGEWVVGEEKGLDFHKGTLWYGGGETIYLGKGF